MINLLIHQEDTAITNVYASNNRASKYVTQKVTEVNGEVDNFIVTGEDFL